MIMGFFRSLTRELGRNTGKWVSNKVFKDGWSTPYRFSRMRSKDTTRAKNIRENAGKMDSQNANSAFTSSGSSFKTSASEANSHPVLVKLRNLDVLSEGGAIVNQLEFLLGVLIEHQGSDGIEKKIRSIAFAKYRLALHRLRSQDPDAARYFKSELKSIRRRSIGKVLLAILGLIVLWILAMVTAEL